MRDLILQFSNNIFNEHLCRSVLSEKKNGVCAASPDKDNPYRFKGESCLKILKNAMKALTNKVKSAYSMAKRFVKSCKKRGMSKQNM